jgi:hypothetical protein
MGVVGVRAAARDRGSAEEYPRMPEAPARFRRAGASL